MNNFDDNLDIFVKEGIRLINTSQNYSTSTIYGTNLHVDNGKRFLIVRGNEVNPSYPKGYTYARIEKGTGKVFSQSGKKSRGTIFSKFSGTELITRDGVMVYDEFILEKFSKLEERASIFMAWLYVPIIFGNDISSVIYKILCNFLK